MADLGIELCRRDRGQLLAVGGLVIALLLVLVALLLNTAIFIENVSTRGEYTGKTTGISVQKDITRTTGQALDAKNREVDASYSELATDYIGILDTLENSSEISAPQRGYVQQMDYVVAEEGIRVVDANATGNLSDAGNDNNWTVTTSTDDTRNFGFALKQSSLKDPIGETETDLLNSDVFRIVATDGVGAYTVFIYADGGATEVRVLTPTGTLSSACSTTESVAEINITTSQVDGEYCEPLQKFDEEIGKPYSLRFKYGGSAIGTYSGTFDSDSVPFPGTNYASDTSGDYPYISEALYAVIIDVLYQDSTTKYEAELRVAPGETA